MDKKNKNEEIQLRNLAAGLSYETSEFNSPNIKDADKKLTDGLYGTIDYQDTAWKEYKGGITRSIVFDLGEKKSIRSIKANFLEDSPRDIEFPHTVSFYASADRKEWGTIAHVATIHRPFMKTPARAQMYQWDGIKNGVPKHEEATEVYTRYIRVTFKTNGLILADEIEIWGADEKLASAVELMPEQYAYLEPGAETAGIKNLMLLYNGWYENNLGDWTREKIIPYISYINKEKQPQEWFFDAVLYLGLWSPENRSFEGYTAPTNKKDWEWYLEKSFQEDGDFSELNEAVKEVGEILGDKGYKLKVVYMIPYPSHLQTDFGDVTGDGKRINFHHEEVGETNALENRKQAIAWYINKVMDQWEKANYSHLILSGLYWLHEGVEYDVPKEKELLQYTSSIVHKLGLKFFWIPYFNASYDFAWKELGFDAVAAQSNHFFFETEASRIQDCAQLAKQYGMGFEMEFDERINESHKESTQKFLNYLNGGVDYDYMKHSYRAYYQGNIALLEAALSNNPDIRKNYDMVHQFVKGTYKKQ